MERLGISAPDVARWEAEGRFDILAEVGDEATWAKPGPCPFVERLPLNRYACRIYDTRPQTCREYPLAIGHMDYVGCEMLEPGDTERSVADYLEKQVPAG